MYKILFVKRRHLKLTVPTWESTVVGSPVRTHSAAVWLWKVPCLGTSVSLVSFVYKWGFEVTCRGQAARRHTAGAWGTGVHTQDTRTALSGGGTTN